MQIAIKVETSMMNSDQGSTAPNARGEKMMVNRNSLYGILAKICRSLSRPNVLGKKPGETVSETPVSSCGWVLDSFHLLVQIVSRSNGDNTAEGPHLGLLRRSGPL